MTHQDTVEINKKQIIQLYKDKIGTSTIAKQFNVNSYYIWKLLKYNNVYIKPRSKYYGTLNGRMGEIKDLINSGVSFHGIAKQIGCSRCSLMVLCKKYGLTSTHKSRLNPNKTTLKSRLNEVVKLYNEGVNCSQIAKQMGYNQVAVWTLLNKYGYDTTRKIYSLDVNFFDSIIDENTSYILGWAYSDGNVDNIGKFRISIQERDVLILEKMATILKYGGPLYYKKAKNKRCQPQVELCINRKEFTDKLIALGCVPAKSMILTFPNDSIVPAKWKWHFLRGYFDGDGSVGKSYANIVGTMSFIYDLQLFLNKYDIQSKIYQRYKNRKSIESSHQLYISKKEHTRKFFMLLYEDATIYMDRKFAKARLRFTELNPPQYTVLGEPG